MTKNPAMIFHAAYPLSVHAKSASGRRPVLMREAFSAIGYDVYDVSGGPTERMHRISQLESKIKAGLTIDFVYSESATSPTGVGRPYSRHSSLTRDLSFLEFCSKQNIPVGLFYRDVYWQFAAYTKLVRWPLSTFLRVLYKWDLRRYKRAGMTIYLPSMKMQKWIPILSPEVFKALPPGANVVEHSDTAEFSAPIRLLYVGGLGSHYRLQETVEAIAGRDDVELTICTRETEWSLNEAIYSSLLAQNVRIVHSSGRALIDLYARADICILAVEPFDYWEFAVPFKLFEYLGNGKPIIASRGTYSAEFVQAEDLGWVVRYGSNELAQLLDKLSADPRLISEKAEHVRSVRLEHTWEERAQQVVRDLVESGSVATE